MTEDEASPTLKEKLKSFRNSITVEPIIILMILSHTISEISVHNLNIEKACRANVDLNKTTCDNLVKNPNFDNTTKLLVTPIVINVTTWSRQIAAAIPAIIILFVGSWSDRTGLRKPCIVIPVIGFLVSVIGLIFSVIFFSQWPVEVAGVFESVPVALTGGKPILLLGIYSYLADHTTIQERTARISILTIISSISGPVGTAISGKLFKIIGYYGVFGICLVLYIIAFIYAIIQLRDINPKEDDSDRNKFRQFFDLSHLLSCYKMLAKNRPSNRRGKVLLLLAAYFLYDGPTKACDAYIYFYARNKYNMDSAEFGYFFAYVIVLTIAGMSLGTLIMHKYLKFSDSLMAFVSIVFRLIAVFIYSFGPTKAWFYAAPVVENFGAVLDIAVKSLLSKLVMKDELGKINSVLGLSSSIGLVATQPLFGFIFNNSSKTFLGMHIAVSGIFMFISTIFILLVYLVEKKITDSDLGLEDITKEDTNNTKQEYTYDNEVTSF